MLAHLQKNKIELILLGLESIFCIYNSVESKSMLKIVIIGIIIGLIVICFAQVATKAIVGAFYETREYYRKKFNK